MPWHPLERATLVQALRDAGPDAPTLCTGWTSRHLAAHIVLRESAPLVAVGVRAPASSTRTPSAPSTGSRSGPPTRPAYAALVARVEQGPAPLAADRLDRRRGLPAGAVRPHRGRASRGRSGAAAGPLDPAHTEAIWSRLVRQARLLYRRAGVGIVLVVPGGPRQAVRQPPRRRRHGRRARRGRRDRPARLRPARGRAGRRPRRPGRRRAAPAVAQRRLTRTHAASARSRVSGRRRPPRAARP